MVVVVVVARGVVQVVETRVGWGSETFRSWVVGGTTSDWDKLRIRFSIAFLKISFCVCVGIEEVMVVETKDTFGIYKVSSFS